LIKRREKMEQKMLPVVSKLVEGKYGLYLVTKLGTIVEQGDRVSVVIKVISDMSDLVRQIRVPLADWELLKKGVDTEFGLIKEEETNE